MKKSPFAKPLFSSLALALASFLLSSGVLAETYVATLSGVECEGCKTTIARSLTQIPAVQTIRIEKIGDEKHRMTVITDGSAPVSQEQAAAAIAEAEHYDIESWSEAAEAPAAPTHAEHSTDSKDTSDSWLGNGWDKIVGTWEEEDGVTLSFGWKFPGHVLESFIKLGESEKYSIMWQHPTTGEISILSTDNKGGQSMGTCSFGADKAVVEDSYVSSNGNTGDKVTVYTLEGDTLTFQINDREPRVLKRQ